MSEAGDAVVSALALPDAARQVHRLTKKDIVGQWDQRSPADAKLLGRVVASARIVGVLSPATLGVPAVRAGETPVDVIPIIDLELAERTSERDRTRAAELMHRALPRPAVLAVSSPREETRISLALTRLSKTEAGMSVVEAHLVVELGRIVQGSLAVQGLDRSDLGAVYRDIVRVAAADGRPASRGLDAAAAVGLRHRIAALADDEASARREAGRERAMQRRIDLNARVAAIRRELSAARAKLFAPEALSSSSTQDHKVGP